VKPVKKCALSDGLAEISGITFLQNERLIAIEDLHPTLYELRLNDSTGLLKASFRETDKKFDFEDLTAVGDTIYALWSHGAIFKITKQKKGLLRKERKHGKRRIIQAAYDPCQEIYWLHARMMLGWSVKIDKSNL
jgi:hypothetical protein